LECLQKCGLKTINTIIKSKIIKTMQLMKNLLFLTALISITFTSCSQIKKENTTIKPVNKEHAVEKKSVQQENIKVDNYWLSEIKLNNGDKWEANIETTQGVDKMIYLINTSKPKNVDDYLTLANTLNDVKNNLVKACTMKGPSHDNLHIFLHPLIEKINLLLKTKTMEEGLEITTSIQENLEPYQNYFK